MKITVVMASHLKPYPNAASNREKKFIRAVNSFLKQTHEDKELIIVSDGCEMTNKLYEENFKNIPNIKIFKSAKMPMYHGGIRHIGLKMAEGEIITYLDSDDVNGKNHLQIIIEQFEPDKYDFVYYDDYLVLDKEFKKFELRHVQTRWGSIGTSSITHKNFLKYKFEKIPEWPNGYSHDFIFILDMVASGMKFKKLEKAPQYFVCHTGNTDF